MSRNTHCMRCVLCGFHLGAATKAFFDTFAKWWPGEVLIMGENPPDPSSVAAVEPDLVLVYVLGLGGDFVQFGKRLDGLLGGRYVLGLVVDWPGLGPTPGCPSPWRHLLIPLTSERLDAFGLEVFASLRQRNPE